MYDKNTGDLRWRKAYRKIDIGKIAGSVHNRKIKPYLLLKLYGKTQADIKNSLGIKS